MGGKKGRGIRLLNEYVPVTEWLPSYRAKWLLPDIIAGITVWALLVPEAMAYAQIAGVPVQYGLYAAPFALLGYAVFGTSRRLFIGPVSTIAIVSASAIAPLAAANSQKYLSMTIALAVITGVLLVVAGLARMGFISKFLAKPVLTGFIIGLALNIAVGQSGKLVGVHLDGETTVSQLVSLFKQIGSWSWLTLAVGAGCLAVLFFMSAFAKRVPGALVVAVVGTLLAWGLSLQAHGLAVVGSVPRGLPGWQMTGLSMNDMVHLIPGAFAVMLVGLAEALAVAKSYAAKYDEEVVVNQELIGYGMANLGAGLFQGFAVSGSLSKTAAADEAGGKTPMVLVTCSVLTMLTILFLTGLFKYLPEAVLGAIVIHALWSLFDFKEMARLYRIRKTDFALAAAALLGVIVIGVIAGIVIGILLSLIAFIDRASRPHTAVLGKDPAGPGFGDIEEHPGFITEPGLLVYRFEAPLVFTNAEYFADDLLGHVRASDPPLETVVVDCELIYDMDTTAADQMVELHKRLASMGVRLVLARVHQKFRDCLDLNRVLEIVGEENISRTIIAAYDDFRFRHGGTTGAGSQG
ncbi:MAG: sulfate permease [Actinobacteria bacterium]|nr:sulfate permease [Actinomycetota bacterium]MBU2686947.1 sulfate permease [Actinomycetota bacterium]